MSNTTIFAILNELENSSAQKMQIAQCSIWRFSRKVATRKCCLYKQIGHVEAVLRNDIVLFHSLVNSVCV